MSVNNLLQHWLDKAETLFSKLPASVQDYLCRPIVRRAVVLVAAIQLLRITNSYLSKRVQNNWIRSRPWNPSEELVLLTGGSGGIGKEIMQELSKLGVKIIIFDVHEPKFPLPSNVFFYKVDLTSSAAIKEVANQLRRDHGHPTVLINNAGVAFAGTILDEPEEQIRLTFEVNTLSHFWTVKEFLPNMVKNDHGHIVNIASVASFAALGEMADYSGSKAAALAFHEGLTQEIRHWYGAKGVRTSIFHPLWVQTPMIEQLVQHSSHFRQPIMTPDKVSQAVVKKIANGDGGQVVVPSNQGFIAMVRGLPNWIQELGRDRSSGDLIRLRRFEQQNGLKGALT